MILRALLSTASKMARCETGASTQKREQYYPKKVRLVKEKHCTTENAQKVSGFGGHLGNMVCPRMIMADGEAQTSL